MVDWVPEVIITFVKLNIHTKRRQFRLKRAKGDKGMRPVVASPRPGIWQLKQPRRRRRQERQKFAYLTMKNSSLACFVGAEHSVPLNVKYHRLQHESQHYFCTLRTCNFRSFQGRFRPISDVKWPVLQLPRRREHLTSFQFFSSNLHTAHTNLLPG